MGVKRPGCGVDHPLPSRAEVKERVQLYHFSPSGPSWSVTGWTLPFTSWHVLIIQSHFTLSEGWNLKNIGKISSKISLKISQLRNLMMRYITGVRKELEQWQKGCRTGGLNTEKWGGGGDCGTCCYVTVDFWFVLWFFPLWFLAANL